VSGCGTQYDNHGELLGNIFTHTLQIGGRCAPVSLINATFDVKNVVEMTFRESPDEVYDSQRAALADDDLKGRLDLAWQMHDMEALNLAKFELTALERDFPNTAAVAELLGLVEAKLRLQETQNTRRSDRPRAEKPPRERRERSGNTEEHPYLTDEQTNLIKIYEIDLDEKPRVTISSATLKIFFERYGDQKVVPIGRKERSAFRRKPGYEQLALFFRVQARDLYAQVKVKQEPAPLSEFRRNVNPRYVARYFASTFGQGQVQGLHLFSDRTDNEQEAYTNFYLLTQFRYEGLPMIDRTNPEQSLLLQWGLKREAARSPAPEIEGWKPAFNSPDDAKFQRYADWIATLFEDEPNYGITYPPPAEKK